MELKEACQSLLERVEGAWFAAVVDFGSGALSASEGRQPLDDAQKAALCRSSLELFEWPTPALVDGGSPLGQFDEVLVASAVTCHFAKVFDSGRSALVLVTRKDANVGLGWAEVKATAGELERRAI